VNCVAHYNLQVTNTTVINNHQHCFWHVAQWNERLFEEMMKAYLDGRAAADPSESWYKGVRCFVCTSAFWTLWTHAHCWWVLFYVFAAHQELGFFDFYIIPLAKKLESCGV
jgi:hypothetical protein